MLKIPWAATMNNLMVLEETKAQNNLSHQKHVDVILLLARSDEKNWQILRQMEKLVDRKMDYNNK